MAFTINRRLSTLVDSNGQLKTGKIPNDYIDINHIADNSITTAMLHTGFTLPISSLTSIDTDDITEGSTNLFYTDARVDSHLSGGTGVTYSSGAISIGQAVSTSDSPTFADLTVTGNLNITGDINSYNVTDLDITDQTITLGAGQIEANSGGSGIIIDGASASILWDETNDQFDFNKGINIDSNTLVVDGTNNRVGILQASPAVSLDVGSATDALFVPKGTTAERPTGVDGYFRYNTDDAQFEGYADGAWGAIAGSGGAAMETDNFTGDGSTTDFTLTSSVSDEDNLLVFIEGVYQNKADYVASGTTLTFDVAPVNGRNIVAYHIRSNISGSNVILTSLTGDGSTVAFTLTAAPGNENNTQVFMDGVYQQKDSYITSGTTLTFDAAPANGTTIEVISYTQTTINEPTDGSVTTAKVANEAITSAKIDSTSTGIAFADLTVDTDTLVVDATNNRIGIGTTSPDTIMEIVGTDPILTIRDTSTSGADSHSTLRLAESGASDTLNLHYDISLDEGDLTFNFDQTGTNPVEMMRIDGLSGNVGIGEDIPLQKLHVNSGTGNSAAIFESTDSTSQIWLKDSASSTTYQTGIACYGDNLLFNNGGERMRIDASGNVGIGTTSPNARLEIKPAASSNYLQFNDSSDTEKFRIDSNFRWAWGTTTPTQDFDVRNTSGNAFFALDRSNGHVGIGTDSPSALLELRGSAKFAQENSAWTFDDSVNGRIGFVKKAGLYPYLAAASGMPLIIGRSDANPLTSGVSSQTLTESARFDSSGSFEFNTTANLGARYFVVNQAANQDGGFILRVGNSNKWQNAFNAAGELQWYSYTASSTVYKLLGSGVIQSPPTYAQTTSNSANMVVRSNGDFERSTSSERYKNSITDATKGLAELKTLRPVNYKGNNDGDTIFYGLIAEEVHDAGLTEFVEYDNENKPDALRYPHMVSLCVKAIQEQQAQIETLKQEIREIREGG